MRVASLLGLSLSAIACAQKPDLPAASAPAVPAALSAADIEAVKGVDMAFATAMNAKDTAAVFALYAPEAKVLPPDSPILDLQASHAGINGLIAGGASDFVLNSGTPSGVGDVAYTVGTGSFKMGGAVQQLKFAEVFRKGADGKWRYVVDTFSGVTPPAAPAAKQK